MRSAKWKKVKGPTTWRPEINDELVGCFGGRSLRNGSFGPYEIVILHTDDRTYTVSGTVLLQLVESANPQLGDLLRVVYKGTKPTALQHDIKIFELYTKKD